MFSVGYNNKAMVINAVGTYDINSHNVENLRRLIIQLLKNPCRKIIFDMDGINAMDSLSVEVIDRLYCLASSQNVILEFANVDKRIKPVLFAAGIEVH